MASLPLHYWCDECGILLFRSDRDASAMVETVCRNRRCRLNRQKEPRVIRLPEDARSAPLRFGHGAAIAQTA